MKIPEFFAGAAPVFSFEFFLPKAPEDMERFKKTVARLKKLEPSFVTMTYGAGGSERGKTVETAGMIKKELGIETAAHLTCITHTRAEIVEILDRLRERSVENIVALRGDRPKDSAPVPPEDRELPYARDLVQVIREAGGFSVAVAGYPEKHPESPDRTEDVRRLKEKVDAGADWVITQLFFDNRDYFDFVKRARAAGVACPIVPGIMPVTSFAQTQRFTALCGASIPEELLERLRPVAQEKEKVVEAGIDYAARQCRELLERGAPGIHFYTLNKSRSTETILTRLRRG